MTPDYFTPAKRENDAEAGGADPFVIVAGLIAAILLGSLLLWINGHEEISSMPQFYGSDVPVTTSASLDTPA